MQLDSQQSIYSQMCFLSLLLANETISKVPPEVCYGLPWAYIFLAVQLRCLLINQVDLSSVKSRAGGVISMQLMFSPQMNLASAEKQSQVQSPSLRLRLVTSEEEAWAVESSSAACPAAR